MHTYFISDGLRVKIGKSRNPEARLGQLQTAHPGRLTLLLVLFEDQEKLLHQRFAEFRLTGEWFILSEQIQAFIDDPTTPWVPVPVVKIKRIKPEVEVRRHVSSEDILSRFRQAGGRVHHFKGKRRCYATTIQKGPYRLEYDFRYLIQASTLIGKDERYTLSEYCKAVGHLVTEAKSMPPRLPLLIDVKEYLDWIDAKTLPDDAAHGAINSWCSLIEIGCKTDEASEAYSQKYYKQHLSVIVDAMKAERLKDAELLVYA